MKHKVLLDYEMMVEQRGFAVRALLKLEGQAPTTARRMPLNLSIVLDRSSSMAGEKLVAAREAAAFLVRRLHPEDVVSVVAYDQTVTTVAEPATGAEQGRLAREIAAIPAGGSTNLSGGWLRGSELVQEMKGKETMNRVLLLTDGQANVGITDADTLAQLCSRSRKSGVTTSTIGFGADYDEKLLRGMADAGGGNTWYIERADQAAGVFEEEIEGLLSLCAHDVTVEVCPGDQVTMTAVHNDYPARRVARGLRVQLGDVYAREPKSLLMEFFVPGLDPREMIDIAEVSVQAHVLTEGGGVEKQRISFSISSPLAAGGHREPEVQREVLLMAAAKAREAALERRDRGDWEGARMVVREAASRLAASGMEFDEQVADLRDMETRLTPAVFSPADAKYMAQRSYNQQRGKTAYEEKLRRRQDRTK